MHTEKKSAIFLDKTSANGFAIMVTLPGTKSFATTVTSAKPLTAASARTRRQPLIPIWLQKLNNAIVKLLDAPVEHTNQRENQRYRRYENPKKQNNTARISILTHQSGPHLPKHEFIHAGT